MRPQDKAPTVPAALIPDGPNPGPMHATTRAYLSLGASRETSPGPRSNDLRSPVRSSPLDDEAGASAITCARHHPSSSPSVSPPCPLFFFFVVVVGVVWTVPVTETSLSVVAKVRRPPAELVEPVRRATYYLCFFCPPPCPHPPGIGRPHLGSHASELSPVSPGMKRES